MWAPESPDDAEAQTLRAFLQTDAAGPRTPEEEGEGSDPGKTYLSLYTPVRVCVCVCTHSGSAVGVSVFADRLELLDKLST